MKKRTKIENNQRGLPQPSQPTSDDAILSNYSSSITNFLNQLKLQEPELDFINPFQEITADISKHIHHHPSRIPLAAISASWQRLSNEILFQVQQVNQKASDSMIQQKITSLRSAISQIRSAAPSYQAYKKEHQTLYQQIKKSISLIQQSIEVHDENRSLQQLAKLKTDLTHSFAKFFQLADMDKTEASQVLKQCKRDVNQIQRLLAGTNPTVIVPPEFSSFTKYVNSLKFENKKAEPTRRSKTPPARFPNLLCSLPKPGFSQNNNKNPASNSKLKASPSNAAILSATASNSSAPQALPQGKEKYVNSSRKIINRSKTPPSRPILMKTIANAQKPRISKFSAVENYIFPKQYNSAKPGSNSTTLSSTLTPQTSPFLLEKDKKPVSSIKPIGKRPVSPPNSKVSPNPKLNLNLNLNSLSNTNNEASRSNSARDKVPKSGNSAKNSSRLIKKDSSKPSLSSISRPVSPGATKTPPSKLRQPSYLKSPPQQNQSQPKSKQQQKQSPKSPKNQPIQRNQNQVQNQNPVKKNKLQDEPNKTQTNYKRNPNINRYMDDNDIDNDIYNDNSNDDYNENEIDNDNDPGKQKLTSSIKRTDSNQSFDSATDQLVMAMNKAKEQVRVSSPTLEKLQRDLSFEGLFFEGDEPVEITITHLYESFSKKLNLFDQLIIANDKINELNQKVEQNTWKDDKELEDYLSFIDENSIIVQFLSREKEIVYDTAKSMRQMNEKIDYYLNRNNHYASISNSNNNDDVNVLKNQNLKLNDDLTDLYATIEDQLAQISKQSSNEKERNENKKIIKKFDSTKNIFYEFTEKVNEQNRIEEIKLENESIKRRIKILKSIQSSSDNDNDSNDNDNENDNENKDEFDISLLNENELNEMSLEEVLSVHEYLNNNKNKIKSNFVEDPKIAKNRDKFRPSEEQLKTLSSIHQQLVDLQNALVSIQNDEQKVSINDQLLTRNEIESSIMKLITQEKNILQSIK